MESILIQHAGTFIILATLFGLFMAWGIGANDVANAIGPVAAIVSIVQSAGEIASKSATPIWILMLGGGGIVFGLMTYGHKVIATVGSGITELTPSRGSSPCRPVQVCPFCFSLY